MLFQKGFCRLCRFAKFDPTVALSCEASIQERICNLHVGLMAIARGYMVRTVRTVRHIGSSSLLIHVRTDTELMPQGNLVKTAGVHERLIIFMSSCQH